MGSNQTEDDEFLRTIKNNSKTFFRREVKPSAPCHKILPHVKETYCWQNSWPFLAKFLPASLSSVPAGYCQTALVDEPGMNTELRWEIHKRSENG
jgi:hypothetical protein